MSTVFDDPLFLKSKLYTADGSKCIECTIKGTDGRSVENLVRNDNRGYCTGRMINPVKIPKWLVPETILYGDVRGVKVVLTFRSVIQSRISGIDVLLGDKLSFSYVTTTEFN